MWNKIKVWVDSYPKISFSLKILPNIIPLILSVYFSLGGILTVFFLILVVINVVIVWIEKQNKKKIQELEKENEKKIQELEKENEKLITKNKELYKIFKNIPKYCIVYLYEELQLSVTERLTLYKIDDKKNFEIIARYSKNGDFTDIYKYKYGKNTKILKECITKGCYENTCEENILEDKKMKPIVYLGQRLEKSEKYLGILLYESVEKKNKSEIDKIHKKLESNKLFIDILSYKAFHNENKIN